MSGANPGILRVPPFPRVSGSEPTPGSAHNNAMAQIERAFSSFPVGTYVVELKQGTVEAFGTVTIGGGLTLDNGGTLSGSGGTLTDLHAGSSVTLSPGTITSSGTISVTPLTAGIVSSNGTVLEATTLAGLTWLAGTLTNSGVLALNQGTINAAGTIVIGSNLTLNPGGTLVAATGGLTGVTAGAGITTALGSTNGTITSAGTLYSIMPPIAQTGTTYAIGNADQASRITFSNTAAIAVSIAQAGAASSFLSGWWCEVENIGAGLVTITPATSTIAGVTTFELMTGYGVRVTSDGSNYKILNSPALYALPNSSISNWLPGIPSAAIGGNARGIGALDIQVGRSAATQVASGNQAVAVGYRGTASGDSSNSLGTINAATAQNASAVGSTNTASALNASAVGFNNTANKNNSSAFGASNTAQGVAAFAGGSSSNADGDSSVAVGDGANTGAGSTGSVYIGQNGFANGLYSRIFGRNGDDRINNGAFINSPIALGTTGTKYGRSQTEEYVFVASTSGATAVRLTADALTAGAFNVAALGSNMTMMFDCWIEVTDTTNSNYVTYYMAIPASISRVTTAATTALGTPGPAFTAGSASATPLVLAVAPTITADTTNGGFNLSYTPPVANTNLLYAVARLRILTTRFN